MVSTFLYYHSLSQLNVPKMMQVSIVCLLWETNQSIDYKIGSILSSTTWRVAAYMIPHTDVSVFSFKVNC